MATNPQPASQKERKLLTAKFQQLLAKVAENRPKDDPEIIRKAYEFSLKHHQGQTRASGEPYLIHPLEVAVVLADMKLDSTAIAAGLLHDAIEDTEVTHEDVRREFGDQVVHIVEGVTKIDKIDFASREERQAENVRKMVLAMVDDIRVVLIKLADRLHNMRTLQHLPEERRQNVAKETLEIYAPLAHRLGMGKVRGELEDLSFRYVDPIGYQQVHEAVETRRKTGEAFLANRDIDVITLSSDKFSMNIPPSFLLSQTTAFFISILWSNFSGLLLNSCLGGRNVGRVISSNSIFILSTSTDVKPSLFQK